MATNEGIEKAFVVMLASGIMPPSGWSTGNDDTAKAVKNLTFSLWMAVFVDVDNIDLMAGLKSWLASIEKPFWPLPAVVKRHCRVNARPLLADQNADPCPTYNGLDDLGRSWVLRQADADDVWGPTAGEPSDAHADGVAAALEHLSALYTAGRLPLHATAVAEAAMAIERNKPVNQPK